LRNLLFVFRDGVEVLTFGNRLLCDPYPPQKVLHGILSLFQQFFGLCVQLLLFYSQSLYFHLNSQIDVLYQPFADFLWKITRYA
jgi:hypothetical protein